jgi:nucleotide-binding universal stress UspA family protein
VDPVTPPVGAIVVGVDGSSGADVAIDWAAGEAAVRRRPLVLVHAEPLLADDGRGWLADDSVDIGDVAINLRDAGHGLLELAETRATRAHPTLTVHRSLRATDPRTALLELSADAELVVLGSHGRGPIASMVLGSVSVEVARRSQCPAVVAREPREPGDGRGVLVGVDAARTPRDAVDFAYEMAGLHDLPLTLLHCFSDLSRVVDGPGFVADDEGGLNDERQTLAQVAESMANKHPRVTVRTLLARGPYDHHLVSLSRTQAVLVVDGPRARPPGHLAHLSRTLLLVENAGCTTVVVPRRV